VIYHGPQFVAVGGYEKRAFAGIGETCFSRDVSLLGALRESLKIKLLLEEK
jgi:hypothetical protein